MTDAIGRLQPRDEDPVHDQRFGVVLSYKFRHDRTQRELLEMAEAEKQRHGAIKLPATEKAVQK